MFFAKFLAVKSYTYGTQIRFLSIASFYIKIGFIKHYFKSVEKNMQYIWYIDLLDICI